MLLELTGPVERFPFTNVCANEKLHKKSKEKNRIFFKVEVDLKIINRINFLGAIHCNYIKYKLFFLTNILFYKHNIPLGLYEGNKPLKN